MKKTDFNRLSSHDGYALSTAVGIGKFHCRYHNQNIPRRHDTQEWLCRYRT
ncbi:hypothetical protein ACMSEJ_23930 [Bacteroides thetaiotaomicron]|uniref:hypothetical protein n=1 Tax=Bacteroides thetaiotaomicron TaxID=818 RepID=UPI00159EE12F|nr:hypothetical protein [Bacteroides thetaiotaomicron]